MAVGSGATMCYLCRTVGITYDHFCQHFRDPGVGRCTQCQKQCLLHEDAGKRDDKIIEDIKKREETDSGAGTSGSAAEVTASTSGAPPQPQQAQAQPNPIPQQRHFNFGPNPPIQPPPFAHQANPFAHPHGFHIPHPQFNQPLPPYPPVPHPAMPQPAAPLNGAFFNPQPQMFGINPFQLPIGNQFPHNHQAYPAVVNNGGVIGNQANGAN